MHEQQVPEREVSTAAARVSLFTVKDIGRALGNFLGLVVVYILSVVIYELSAGWRGVLATGWLMFIYSPPFLASATILIISREGGDIVLFHRWAAARRQHAENVAKAKDEGRHEKQQEWTAWNARRLQAAAKGEPFNEPPPQ